jgi:hypothetical protein
VTSLRISKHGWASASQDFDWFDYGIVVNFRSGERLPVWQKEIDCKDPPYDPLWLVDGRHASISFDYEAAQFAPPRTKAVLDRMFGHAAWKMVKPTHFPDGSWFQGQNAEWKTRRIKVQLMLMGGRNVKGEEYMNATLIFVDTSVPDPVEDRLG